MRREVKCQDALTICQGTEPGVKLCDLGVITSNAFIVI